MNKYKLRMRTLTGLGNEYVYVYATSNFERYLNIHNLKYVRDITKDYQLTDRFEQLQQENQQLKERIDYLERSNNRREDTIIEDREEITTLYSVLDEIRELVSHFSGGQICECSKELGMQIEKILDKVKE